MVADKDTTAHDIFSVVSRTCPAIIAGIIAARRECARNYDNYVLGWPEESGREPSPPVIGFPAFVDFDIPVSGSGRLQFTVPLRKEEPDA